MTYFDDSLSRQTKGISGFFARLFETDFDRRTRALRHEVESLRALSDAELLRRGLRREDIVVHVFSRR